MRWRKNPDGDGPDFVHWFPRSCDGHLLHLTFATGRWDSLNKCYFPSFLADLEKRGYDLKTLEFTIRLKEEAKP
jgi:hypothetical protein